MIIYDIKKYLNINTTLLDFSDNFDWIKVYINYLDSNQLIYEYPIDISENYNEINNIVIPDFEKVNSIEILTSFDENLLSYSFSSNRLDIEIDYDFVNYNADCKHIFVSVNNKLNNISNNLVLFDNNHSNGTYFICDDDGNPVFDNKIRYIKEKAKEFNIEYKNIVFIIEDNYMILIEKLFNEFQDSLIIINRNNNELDYDILDYELTGFIQNRVIKKFLEYHNVILDKPNYKLIEKKYEDRLLFCNNQDIELIAKYISSKKIFSKGKLKVKSINHNNLNYIIFLDSNSEMLMKLCFEKSIKFLKLNNDKFSGAFTISADILLKDVLKSISIIKVDNSKSVEYDLDINILENINQYIEKIKKENVKEVSGNKKYLGFTFNDLDNINEIPIKICDEDYNIIYQIFPPITGDGIIQNIIINEQSQSISLKILSEINVNKYSVDFYDNFKISEKNNEYFEKYKVNKVEWENTNLWFNKRGNKKNPKKIIVNFPGFYIHTSPLQYTISYYKKLNLLLKKYDILIYSFVDTYFSHGTYMLVDNNSETLTNKIASYLKNELIRYNLEESDILFFGASKGGTIAINISSQFNNNSLISVAPQLDLEKYAFTRNNFRNSTLKYLKKENIKLDYFYILKDEIESGKNILYIYGSTDYASNGYFSQYLKGRQNTKVIISESAHNEITPQNMSFVDNYIYSFINNFKDENQISMKTEYIEKTNNYLDFKFKIKKINKSEHYIGLINLNDEIETIYKIETAKKYIFSKKSIPLKDKEYKTFIIIGTNDLKENIGFTIFDPKISLLEQEIKYKSLFEKIKQLIKKLK